MLTAHTILARRPSAWLPKREREETKKRGIQFDKRVERPQTVLERAISRPSPLQKG